MPTVAPIWILVATCGLTLVALLASLLIRRRVQGGLGRLAANAGGAYQPAADAGLARRLLQHLPIGAADVSVTDLVTTAAQAEQRPGRRAVGRVDYSLGSVGHRRNCTCLAVFDLLPDGAMANVRLSEPATGPIAAQYRTLLNLDIAPAAAPGPASAPDHHVVGPTAAGDEHLDSERRVEL